MVESVRYASYDWLCGTAPVVLAAIVALLVAKPSGPVVAGVMAAWSTIVEIVGGAALYAFPDAVPRNFAASAVFGLSSSFLAAAWMAGRGWELRALGAAPLAGILSWFVFPTVSVPMSEHVRNWFGEGFGGLWATYAAGYVLTALVIAFAPPAVAFWRRIRPAMETV